MTKRALLRKLRRLERRVLALEHPQPAGLEVTTELVEPYRLVATTRGLYQMRAGEVLSIPLEGAMRALWERQYVAQEWRKEHLRRNKQRAPQMPELAFLDETTFMYPGLNAWLYDIKVPEFQVDPALGPRELTFLPSDPEKE